MLLLFKKKETVNYDTEKKRKKKEINKNNKYIEMHVEKYLFEIINEYVENRKYKNM